MVIVDYCLRSYYERDGIESVVALPPQRRDAIVGRLLELLRTSADNKKRHSVMSILAGVGPSTTMGDAVAKELLGPLLDYDFKCLELRLIRDFMRKATIRDPADVLALPRSLLHDSNPRVALSAAQALIMMDPEGPTTKTAIIVFVELVSRMNKKDQMERCQTWFEDTPISHAALAALVERVDSDYSKDAAAAVLAYFPSALARSDLTSARLLEFLGHPHKLLQLAAVRAVWTRYMTGVRPLRGR